MWRWHWAKYGGKRAFKILLDSAADVKKWRAVLWGAIVVVLSLVSLPRPEWLVSAWQLLPSWVWPAFVLASVAFLFVRGLVKANYEAFLEVEQERDEERRKREELEAKFTTDQKRTDFKALLTIGMARRATAS